MNFSDTLGQGVLMFLYSEMEGAPIFGRAVLSSTLNIIMLLQASAFVSCYIVLVDL
jgi:hypothetical protein